MRQLRGHLGARIARRWMDEGFLAWWGRSLAAWMPLRWRRRLGIDRGRLLLQVHDDQLMMAMDHGEGLRQLDAAPLAEVRAAGLAACLPAEVRDLPRWLVLPAAAGLRRRLVLPRAARDRLREVAGFEIDRQTPFVPASVAYDTRIVGLRGSEGSLEVELVVVPQARLSECIGMLGEPSVSLAGVDLAGGDGAPVGANLLSPAARRQGRGRTWRLDAALATLALLASGWAMGQLLDNRRDALVALQAEADARAAAARQVSVQRRELADLVEGRSYIEGLRRSQPTALEVMDHLAARLPDHTYLERMSIEGGRLSVVGLGSAASTLVPRLTGPGPLRSPALTGVLQPDPASGRERFTLMAELARGGGDAQRD